MSQLEKSPERLSPPDLRFSEDELILLLDTALAVTYKCKTKQNKEFKQMD